MQLTIPDCCLGEFCPGIHVEGHHKREDVSPHLSGEFSGLLTPEVRIAVVLQGTYYSRDNVETNAYHYHNTCVPSILTE